jgi:hypothetical protein
VCVCAAVRSTQRSEPNGNLVLHLVLLVMSAYKQYAQLNTIYKYPSRSIATPSSEIVVPELSEKWQLACDSVQADCTAAGSCNENNFAISPVCGSAFADSASESSYYDAHEHDPSQALPETTAADNEDELDTAMAALHVTTASPIAASAAAAATVAAAATAPARSPSSSPCITVNKRGKKQRFIESSDSDSNDSSNENNFSHVDTQPQLNSSKQSSSSAKRSSGFTQRSPKEAATFNADSQCDVDHDESSDVVDLTETAAAGFGSGSECSFEDIERTRLDINISDDSDSECSPNKRSSKHRKSPYIKGESYCDALNTCVSACLRYDWSLFL